MSFKIPCRAGLFAPALFAAMVAASSAFAQAAEPTVNKGDNTWMLVSTVLVLLMTIPGLALFYGGLVRPKNMLSVLMHVFYTVCIVTLIWVLYGYSLTFTGGSAYIGGFSKAFLAGVTVESKAATFSVGANISEIIYVCFQMTFAAITPALIVGAFAERMKFAALALFIPLWVTFIYFPIAHMVWYWAGPDAIDAAAKALAAAKDDAAKKTAQEALDAVMADAGQIFPWGAIDFAGGTVVHINAGIAGLMGALLVGKRTGFGKELMPPHSLVMTMIGASLLWVGWFGFNAGSNLEATGVAGLAMINTFVATAGAALSWMFAEWIVKGKPSLLGARHRLRRRPCRSHACRRLLRSDGCDRARPDRRRGLPVLLLDDQEHVRIRRLARRVRRALRRRHRRRHRHGHPREPGARRHRHLRLRHSARSPITTSSPRSSRSARRWRRRWSGRVSAPLILYKIVDIIVGLRVTADKEREGLDITDHGERAYNM